MGVLKKIFKSEDDTSADSKTGSIKEAPLTARVAPSAPKALFNDVLLYPVISEKASLLQSLNQYVFAVKQTANKVSIARAVEKAYGVKPAAVRVIWVGGKKRVRGRRQGKTTDWKKAVVTLPAGKSITIAEGV